MTLPALDMGLSSASPLPEGTIEPTTGDGSAEPAATPEAPAAKSPSGQAAPAKPPAASLISIAAKGKPSGPTKTGDLTRFFELSRRQAPLPTTPAEPLSAVFPAPLATEVEVAPQPLPAASPIETPVQEVLLEPAPFEAPSAPEPVAITPPPEAVIAPEATLEPRFPLMLAPPAVQSVDRVMLVHSEPESAPATEVDVVAAPDWLRAASTIEAASPSETTDPLDVALAPALELPPVAIAPVEPAPALVPAAARTPAFKDLVDYWRSLRPGDDHPAEESIDRDLVTERWPGTLLMTYLPASQDPRGESRPSRVTRLGTACAETQSVAEAGSQSTEWMLEVARTALVNDEPVEEQQRLATFTGVAGFRMVALPLGSPKKLASAVLCTLIPNPGAPRFGKRRIWL
jgi:hypothetical protein